MKNLIILLALLSYNLINAQGINFEKGSFAETLAKAKAENKIVFLDAYTTWCGPCKKMTKEVFPQPEVGKYMNANFVSIKFDMEKGEGIQLAKMYNVKAFPTLLFLNSSGKELHRVVKGLNTEELIAEAKIANDPTKQLWYKEKQYNEGKRDLTTVSNYVKGLFEAFKRDEAISIGREYIPSMSKEQYATVEGFTIIAYAGVDYKSEPYNYILNNQSIFSSIKDIGQESVDYVLENAISSYVNNIAKKGTEEELKLAIEETKKDFISPRQVQSEANYFNTYYLANKQFDTWFEANKKQADKETEKNIRLSMYINIAYNIAVNPDFAEAGLFEKAIELTESITSEDPEFLAAYACLAWLYKNLGDKNKALVNVNTFIEKAAAKGAPEDKRMTDLKAAIEKMQ